MKRRLFKLALFIILGAIVNVAVAWGCAVFIYLGPDGSLTEAVTSASFPSADVLVLDAPGALRAYSNFIGDPLLYAEFDWLKELDEEQLQDKVEIVGVDPNLPPHWSHLHLLDPNKDQEVCDDGRGWPFLAMSSAVITPYKSNWSIEVLLKQNSDQLQPFVHGGIVIPPFRGADPGMYRTRILPLKPIWKGFVIDTAFYGLSWCFAYVFFHKLRRRLRIRRLCCPECGYKLLTRFEQGCPECGWGREAKA